MHRLRLLKLFLGPSINSGLLTGLLAVILLSAANFSYLFGSTLPYDFLFGEGTPYDLIQSSRDRASLINLTVLGNPILNKVLFFCFWLMVGMVVYAIITVLGQSFSETESEVAQLRYIHARKAQIEQDLILRIILRATGVLGIFIYGWVFMQILFPYSVYASRLGMTNLASVRGMLYLILSFVLTAVSLHVMVILARLIVLRPRVFGEWDNLG